MCYLIEVDSKLLKNGVSFQKAIDALDGAWNIVANVYSQACGQMQAPSVSLDAIRSSLPRVKLPTIPRSSLVYPAGEDRELSEVHRQLCQVGVLIEALKLIKQLHPKAKVTELSPTQQSGHGHGRRQYDLVT